MNKYFYPIYKMKLKTWIKWWILKRLKESTLKSVTISSGTLTKVDTSKVLSIKEYYGNSVQNGTPSPEAPVEIQTITGENTFTINSNTYQIDLENIELCKIGKYQDKIYKENNKWYIEKKIGKVILNGSENWLGTPNYYTNILYDLIAPTLATERILGLSNNFLVQGYNFKSNNNLYFHPNKNLQIENPEGTYYPTVNDWKVWLSTHNTTVYYVLATPTTEEITNTSLISELNALYEFYVQSTTVSISNDSEIPFEFLLEYYGR